MKTGILLLLGVAALTTVAFNASANDAALSPRAKDIQIIHVQGTAAVPATVASAVALSPKAAASQTQTVSGTVSETNQYLACRSSMTGSSPKAIGACISNAAMSGCVTVAVLK